jgi:hypothetical protein
MNALVPLLALASIGGWPTTFPPFKAALALDRRVPAGIASGAVAEAAAVWAPYGVAIVEAAPAVAPPVVIGGRAIDVVLDVRVAGEAADGARAWSRPFASIRFAGNGSPDSTILLHYDAIVSTALVAAPAGGARMPQWPDVLRRRVLSRVIGRVLAHEIGHWLLASPEHSTTGLMRGHQTIDTLADPDRRPFSLARADIARLRAALTH